MRRFTTIVSSTLAFIPAVWRKPRIVPDALGLNDCFSGTWHCPHPDPPPREDAQGRGRERQAALF